MTIANRFPQSFTHRPGVIRRVIRQGKYFLCGLCQTRHSYEAEAEGCVDRCWQEWSALSPVIRHRHSLKETYCCRFCARDHKTYQLAAKCAAECKSESDQQRRLALEVSEIVPTQTQPRRRTFAAHRLMAVAALKQKQKSTNHPPIPSIEPVTAPFNADILNTPEPQPKAQPLEAAAPAQTPSETAAQGEGEKKKPAEKWYRDNAKYACTVCNERYFTKIEVTKCYDGH